MAIIVPNAPLKGFDRQIILIVINDSLNALMSRGGDALWSILIAEAQELATCINLAFISLHGFIPIV